MDLIEQLHRTKNETLDLFHLPEEELNKTYKPGKWPVRYILHHLSDTETVLLERVQRTISEPRPVINGFDQDAWAEKLDYRQRPLLLSRDLFASARETMIHYASLHYKRNGSLEFVHSETGVRTLAQEIEKTANHNRHHLNQIRAALE